MKPVDFDFLGKSGDRNVFYTHIRTRKDWVSSLPSNNWLVFTIADDEDRELIKEAVDTCLKNKVSYTVSAGTLGPYSELMFDESIVIRELERHHEQQNFSPVTTSHLNFDEGFWFALAVANDAGDWIQNLICIDMTQKGVKNYLTELIEQVNRGWLPDEQEMKSPKYDQ